MVSFQIECSCGAVYQGPQWWAELRAWVHDMTASPSLRLSHALAENEIRTRLGLPPG